MNIVTQSTVEILEEFRPSVQSNVELLLGNINKAKTYLRRRWKELKSVSCDQIQRKTKIYFWYWDAKMDVSI